MERELYAIAQLAEKVEEALELGGGSHAVSDVMANVVSGLAQVFVSPSGRSVLVTEIIDSRRGRSLNIWLTAGELDECIELSRKAVDGAKRIGATQAMFVGRPGWRRIDRVAEDGWVPQAVVFSKKL